jgi:hypothetical protein
LPRPNAWPYPFPAARCFEQRGAAGACRQLAREGNSEEKQAISSEDEHELSQQTAQQQQRQQQQEVEEEEEEKGEWDIGDGEWSPYKPYRKGSFFSKRYCVGRAAYWSALEVAVCLDAEKGVRCDHCKSDVKYAAVVCCDSSSGEYGPVCICEHCVSNLKLATEIKDIACVMLARPKGKAERRAAAGKDLVEGNA